MPQTSWPPFAWPTLLTRLVAFLQLSFLTPFQKACESLPANWHALASACNWSVSTSPLLPFQRYVSVVHAILFEVCVQPATTPRQHSVEPTVYFLSVLIVEVSPFLVWVPPIILGCIPKDACQTLFCFMFSCLCYLPLFVIIITFCFVLK